MSTKCLIEERHEVRYKEGAHVNGSLISQIHIKCLV